MFTNETNFSVGRFHEGSLARLISFTACGQLGPPLDRAWAPLPPSSKSSPHSGAPPWRGSTGSPGFSVRFSYNLFSICIERRSRGNWVVNMKKCDKKSFPCEVQINFSNADQPWPLTPKAKHSKQNCGLEKKTHNLTQVWCSYFKINCQGSDQHCKVGQCHGAKCFYRTRVRSLFTLVSN